jgi:hypothetical protein
MIPLKTKHHVDDSGVEAGGRDPEPTTQHATGYHGTSGVEPIGTAGISGTGEEVEDAM